MKTRWIVCVAFASLWIGSSVAVAQNKTLGVGTTTPNSNAALHVESPTNNQGIIIPRLTTAQRTSFTGALNAGDVGLIVFDTDLRALTIWNGTAWDVGMKTGEPITATNAAATGHAGLFENTDPANANPTVLVTTAGSGNAITATAPIQATQFLGDGSALTNMVSDSLAADAVKSISIQDGAIVDADISNTATIAGTKINPDFGAQTIATTGTVVASSFLGDGSALTNVIADSARTNSVTGDAIVDFTIENKDIAAGAGILGTKINPDFGAQTITTTGSVAASAFLGDGSGLTNMVSDSLAADAVKSISIQDGAIVDADISNTATIAGTKVNPNFGSQAIITTDTVTAAVFVGNGSGLTNMVSDSLAADVVKSISIQDGAIVDADISNTASIAGTKVNPNFGSQAVITTDTVTAAAFVGDGSALTNLPFNSILPLTDTLTNADMATDFDALNITYSGDSSRTLLSLNHINPASAAVSNLLRINHAGQGAAFVLTQSSVLGTGSIFSLTNAANPQQAVRGTTSGTGNAIQGQINNGASTANAVQGSTNGTGAGVRGQNTSAGGGNAGSFAITNATNTGNAVQATTAGTGAAVNGATSTGFAAINGNIGGGTGSAVRGNTDSNLTSFAGNFSSTNPANGFPAVQAGTQGTGTGVRVIQNATSLGGGMDIYLQNATSSAPGFSVDQQGLGFGGNFTINNPSNGSAALQVFNNGTGRGINVEHSGGSDAVRGVKLAGSGFGSAGNFQVFEPTNGAASLYSETQGTGAAVYGRNVNAASGFGGLFEVTNATNNFQALRATTAGTGGAARFETNNAAGVNPNVESVTNSPGGALRATSTGTGYSGWFEIDNPASTSTVLSITTNGTGNAITANAPIQATQFIGDGSLLTGVSGGLSFPYLQSLNTPAPSFEIRNSGNASAARFSINSATSTGNALTAETDGLQAAGRFQVNNPSNNFSGLITHHYGTGTALEAWNYATGPAAILGIANAASNNTTLNVSTNGTGSAANFTINNTSNNSPAVNISTTGTNNALSVSASALNTTSALLAASAGSGNVMSAIQSGTGFGIDIQMNNGSNSLPALNINHSGTGNAITANRPIQATSFIGDGSALTGIAGLTLPYVATNPGAGNTFEITNTGSGAVAVFEAAGTGGRVGSFTISNSSNTAEALFVQSNGEGHASAFFHTGIDGSAGLFNIGNAANTNAALHAENVGPGAAIFGRNHSATSGSAGLFEITNLGNTSSALVVNTSGTGNAITANAPIQATSFIGDGSALTNLPASGWGLSGNGGTVDGIDFIGTTDDVPLTFRVFNNQAGKIDRTKFNTSFGYLTINGSGAGTNNTAFGHQSLSNNSTGSSNDALGTVALFSNTTGGGNTALGTTTLLSNTTGDNNLAVGAGALYSNVAGSNATAIGHRAMFYSNDDPTFFTNRNVAVGFESLRGSTTASANTGNLNTSIGYQTLQVNTSGERNVALGAFSMSNNNSGSYNTSLGQGAGANNYTGNYNTIVGYAADLGSINLTNATAIGANAQVNASNKIRFGDAAVTVIEGQVAFTAASDKRLKSNIQNLGEGLGFVMQLRPVSYLMKNQESPRTNWGFIAQEVEELVGTENAMLTIGGDKDRTLGLRYTDFIAPLVKAMQEQQQIIADLQKKVQNLEDKLSAEAKK